MSSKRRASGYEEATERARRDDTGRSDLLASLSLVAVVLLAFRGGLSCGLVGDDFSLLNYCRLDSLGGALRDFDPFREVWYYRPLTKLVFGISYALWGTTPAPYHVLSLLAHAAAVVLLFLAARRAGAPLSASIAGALLFALHFRQHESVFWFSAISYPLSTALGLASALLFRASLVERRASLLAAALAASAAAMLTKDTAAVVPVLAAAYGVLFGLPREELSARCILRKAAPFAAVFLAGVALQAIPHDGHAFARGGAAFSPKGPLETLVFAERSLALLLPGLEELGEPARGVLASAAALGVLAFVLLRRSRLAWFGLAWALLAFAPFWAFVPRMGDLYLYLPLAGLGLVAADASAWLVRDARPAARGAVAIVFLVFLIWSGARLAGKAARWKAAGDMVSGVVAEVKAAQPSLPRGGALVLEGLPDTIGGVYAFRNALPAVFWLAYGDRTLTVLAPPSGQRPAVVAPRFAWEDGRLYALDDLGRRRLLRAFTEAE